MEVLPHAFSTLVLNGGQRSASHSGHLTSRQGALNTNLKWGWVDPTVYLDVVDKRTITCPSGIQIPVSCPPCSLVSIMI